jgi:hypothetical protein
VLVAPSPKLQDHDDGVLDDRSENVTASGANPEVGVALKSVNTGSVIVVDALKLVETFPAASFAQEYRV